MLSLIKRVFGKEHEPDFSVIRFRSDRDYFATHGVPAAAQARNTPDLIMILREHLSAIQDDSTLSSRIRQYLRARRVTFADIPKGR